MYYLKIAIFPGYRLRTYKENENLDELKEYAEHHMWCYRNYVGIFDEDGNELVNICDGHRKD